jgi:hypothetical protein
MRLPLALFAAAVATLGFPAPADAATYCVKVADNTLQGNCRDVDVGEPSCAGIGACASADPTSVNYCEFVQITDKSCADITAKPGCCFCGETANPGVWSGAACSKKCGTGATSRFIAGSDCKDPAAEAAKPSGGVAVKKAAPIPPLRNPLGTTDVRVVLGRVVNAFLGISGSVALLMFVFGGFTWITSGGSPERIQKGKNAMIWAVIGIAFIFASYAVLNFVFRAISG